MLEKPKEVKVLPLSEEEIRQLGEMLLIQPDLINNLPAEEQADYRVCQQSVIDARRLAPLHEGNIVIL
jgi:hypothetical protein